MDGSNGRLSIAMFPWLAFGHLMPFLELAKSLAQKGHIVSFISTPRNIERLPKLPPNLAPLINLVKFPLPPVDELPANAEATMDLPPDKVPYLKLAYDGLEGPLTSFLEDATPDWIIHDFAPHWLLPIAAKLGVQCAFFSIFKAGSLAFFGPPSRLMGEDGATAPEQLTVVPEWVTFPSTAAFRLYQALQVFEVFVPNPSGVSDTYRIGFVIQGCQVVAIRSCTEIEPQCFRLLEELYEKPVVPIGLLPPTLDGIGAIDEKNSRWFEKQKQGSVLYVAFGSEAQLSKEQVDELAFGLEQSNLPFFWAFRQAATLPEGFEDRTKARGVVCKGWAPQLQILAHPSVGGFLTHSGWSSIIEGIQFGHPFVLFPVTTDQGLNARMVEEMKIGVEIARNENDGSFTRDSVSESLRLVMVEEKGELLRAKAREMREIFGNKDHHDRYVDGFVKYLEDHRDPSVK